MYNNEPDDAGVFRGGRNYDSPKQSDLCGRLRNRSLGLNFYHIFESFYSIVVSGKVFLRRTETQFIKNKNLKLQIHLFNMYFVYFSEAVLATATTRNIKAFALKKKACSNTFFKGQGEYMHIMLESGFKNYPQITIES